MSVSSGTTLISPTTSTLHMTGNDSTTSGPSQPRAPNRNRTTSQSSGTHTSHAPSATAQSSTSHASHNQHGHHAHHSHAHGHGHGHGHTRRRPSAHSAHTTGGHGTTTRRSSEGESGKKVVFAGLNMQAIEDKDGKRRKSERPTSRTSKSDTNLPRLSRTTSEHSNDSQGRPKPPKHKDSGDSVVILDDEGQEVGEEEEEDGEWEEEENSKENSKQATATAMRRTMSDTNADTRTQSPAEVEDRPASIHSPIRSKKVIPPPPALMTRKTTGFAGAVSTPDPTAFPPVIHNETMIEPTRDLKRIPSSKELAIQAVEGERRKVTGAGNWAMTPADAHPPHPDPIRMRSTEGSALPRETGMASADDTSPSFPFPPVSLPPSSAGPHPPNDSRSRTASGPALRHRYSNSSLRSLQSLRAPPHPLNSPTGYRGRAGSAFNSPTKDRQGRSMHQPPIAPPVIYREIAQGHGYDEPEGEITPVQPQSQMARKSSVSSQHNLRAIFAPTSGRAEVKPSSTRSSMGPPGHRRKTATEVAAAAARLHTTNDPALYHQSLGYPSSSAETAHLISRFLPPKKVTRPSWEITAEQVREGRAGSTVGLTDGDYREAHESLVRTMRELGVSQGSRRISRNVSHHSLLGGGGMSSSLGGGAGVDEGLGTLQGRSGTLLVSKGGWGGKTPFELGLERVMAQRPQRSLGY